MKRPTEPRTERGRKTAEKIRTAAFSLLQKEWLRDIPLARLVKRARVERASLLFAFPAGWNNVVDELLFEELGAVVTADTASRSRHSVAPPERVYGMLSPLITRAESTGKLFANLRGAMFSLVDDPDLYAPETAHFIACLLEAVMGHRSWEDLRTLDTPETPDEPTSPPTWGYVLLSLALDLAAAQPPNAPSFTERKRILREAIEQLSRPNRPNS